MLRRFNYDEETLAGKMERLMQKCEDIMERTMKASGCSFMDTFGNLDETTGAVLGGCLRIYKEVKIYSIETVKVFDQMNKNIEELKDENNLLMEQNRELHSLLNTMLRNQEKILEKLNK